MDTVDQDFAELPGSKKRRVEAGLFLAKEGLSSRKLAKLAGLADATEARTLIRQLNEEYDQQGRAFRIEDIAGGYLLMTRSHFADWLRKQSHVPSAQRFSQSSLETLAVVAYRQPVLRAEIEAIRGVGCSEVLKQLMEIDLVRISGRSEDLGRPYLYGTTRRFLQIFGLRSVDRLPRISWVNESRMSMIAAAEFAGSELKESAVTHTTKLQENTEEELKAAQKLRASFDEEDDDGWMEEEDGDDDWDDDEEDGDWGDDEEDEDDDEEDLEEDSGWEEVSDDDDGWVDDEDDLDDDDDDEDEDDWSDEDEEDDDWD